MSVGFKFSLIPFPLKKADVIGHVFTPYSSGDLASNLKQTESKYTVERKLQVCTLSYKSPQRTLAAVKNH